MLKALQRNGVAGKDQEKELAEVREELRKLKSDRASGGKDEKKKSRSRSRRSRSGSRSRSREFAEIEICNANVVFDPGVANPGGRIITKNKE